MALISERALRRRLAEGANRLGVPGVAVGLYQGGAEVHAAAGVTSVDNPLPVDSHTLFQIASTTKTYTATAIMRLCELGRLSLEDRVKQHVPELCLKDKAAEQSATILHLLNHTAGWYGDVYDSMGGGDDALARLVEAMAGFEQNFPLGTQFSYNNISVSLAGRVIEKVTGKTFEAAVDELVLRPLGLDETFWFLSDVMVRRFALGHLNKEAGAEVYRAPGEGRGANPAGGLWSNVRDQIRYARFHLGDGRSAGGRRVLKRSTLELMRRPTVDVPQPGPPVHVGISWFVAERDGRTMVGHGGNSGGANHALEMVPEADFALSVMTNSSPRGTVLEEEIVNWALEAYAGIRKPAEPVPLDLTPAQLREYAGVYSTEAVVLKIKAAGDHLVIHNEIRPEVRKALYRDGQAPDTPPIPFKIAAGDVGIVIDGDGKGMQFKFAREAGRIRGLDMGRFVKKES